MANPYHGNLPDRKASTAGKPNAPKVGPSSREMPMRDTHWPSAGPEHRTPWPYVSPTKRVIPSAGGKFEL